MKQVLVTVCKGIINQVLFFEDEAKEGPQGICEGNG